jgi:hypothetical protein
MSQQLREVIECIGVVELTDVDQLTGQGRDGHTATIQLPLLEHKGTPKRTFAKRGTDADGTLRIVVGDERRVRTRNGHPTPVVRFEVPCQRAAAGHADPTSGSRSSTSALVPGRVVRGVPQ